MPFKRSRSYGRRTGLLRRRGVKRRRTSRTPRTTRALAKRAYSGVKKINRAIELKYIPNQHNNFFPGRQITDYYWLPFNGALSQGTGAIQVIGNKAMLKYLHIQGMMQIYNNRDTQLNLVGNYPKLTWSTIKIWVAIIPRLDTAGSIISTLQDIWEENNSDYLNVTSFKKWSTQQRTKVIFSKLYMLTTYKPAIPIRLKIPIKRLTSWEISDTNDPRTNCLVWGVMSDTSGGFAGLNQVRCDFNTRVTFTDP